MSDAIASVFKSERRKRILSESAVALLLSIASSHYWREVSAVEVEFSPEKGLTARFWCRTLIVGGEEAE